MYFKGQDGRGNTLGWVLGRKGGVCGVAVGRGRRVVGGEEGGGGVSHAAGDQQDESAASRLITTHGCYSTAG